jgi:hypothetical protein
LGLTKENILLKQMLHELAKLGPKIEDIEHGSVTLRVQDGKIIRVEITESKKTA